MKNTLLFIVCCLSWGTTWFAITFQLGTVDPLWSIFYRFILSSAFLGLLCLHKGGFVRYTPRQHCRLVFQGITFCGLPYWLVYLSEFYISSALSAIVCTSILYMNVIIGRIWLQKPVSYSVVAGGLLGSAGIAMIFMPAITSTEETGLLQGLLLALGSAVMFSLGCITCERNEQDGMEILPIVTFSMFYGGLLVAGIALLKGVSPSFEWTREYINSLIYLACIGSVLAFVSYVALIREIGADRAAYIEVIYPIIALVISAFFEGYQWTIMAIIGVIIVLLGNLVAMGALKRQKVSQ